MIVDVLMFCLLVLLVIAVVGLFAMMGELSSKVSASVGTESDEVLWPAENARIGRLTDWPAEIDGVVREGGVVVVLSPTCGACHQILSETPNHLSDPLPLAVVVVAGDEEAGRSFVEEYPLLARLPVHVDVAGGWLRQAVGLDSSPAVLRVEDGHVLEVFNFNRSSAVVALASASSKESRKA
ncbi:hypothetical protein [Pedococcus sp. 5OH_020]|uniref:hypothetical protein n=1 Tax=Pedococcus sp. 5OH_020 TaxID=2989814 RepID=UPI0022EA0D37|nr:hypothetical protein [Pedococcus sp. 5OH_020]